MRFDDVIVRVTYVVSIPDTLPSPTFEAVSGEVEAAVVNGGWPGGAGPRAQDDSRTQCGRQPFSARR